ncbi:MBL fold metallo-hydrolase [Lacticaseibacillus pabuli]|uniref:MBL fold metallo-hydrolase n=1 Tax=Lacticaseibacillus pabuli TaxID=3025672 RepID=A0ABY7WNT6_9LACO|nr:MBL fold metallo-hydrolase [Lacticaseibacillus sp. KACC 23028]WDF81852.1 MBL fold metallo-hydrolase [Lacticaseibacillus sp. KACC 23028]
MEYKIIGSSSAGNCVVINKELMFDIGLPFKRIKDSLYGVKYILISHVHSDHLNPATYRQIHKFFPNIKFIGDQEVNDRCKMDIVAHEQEPIILTDTVITPFHAPHDVQVLGWTWDYKGEAYMFVTDTYSLKYCPDKKYDHFFLEANHDRDKIKAIMGKDQKMFGYSAVDGALRHLSTQDAKAFYYLHRRSEKSDWIQLHKSARFY